MDDTPRPTRRLVICRGQYCNMDRRADRLLSAAEPLIEAINRGRYPPPVRLVTANCLSMCGAGPNCIIQPGGRPFNHLDEAALREIIAQYLADDADEG